MTYNVEVSIVHDDDETDSFFKEFDNLYEANRFVKKYNDGEPGDSVTIYIDDVIWKEYEI